MTRKPHSSPPWDAVFLDRDGTLNVAAPPREYVLHPEEVVLVPGAAEAVARLNAAGVRVFVVTNQRCVALGLVTDEGVAAVNERLVELLAAQGATLEQILVCPHAEGVCECRKPGDGLIRRALHAYPALRPTRCAVVGDSPQDVRCGERLGLFRVLLSTSSGPITPPGEEPSGIADAVVPDLLAAVGVLLDGPGQQRGTVK